MSIPLQLPTIDRMLRELTEHTPFVMRSVYDRGIVLHLVDMSDQVVAYVYEGPTVPYAECVFKLWLRAIAQGLISSNDPSVTSYLKGVK